MKRILFLMLLVATTVSASSAMPNPEKKKKEKPAQNAEVPERRVDPQRISRELGLNDQQSAAFAAVYAEYREALQDGKPAELPVFDGEAEDDLQILTRITDRLEREIFIATVRKEYVTKFMTVLTPQQIDRLYMMERSGNGEHSQQRNPQGEHGGRRDMGGPQGGFGGGPGMGGMGGHRGGGFGGGFGPR